MLQVGGSRCTAVSSDCSLATGRLSSGGMRVIVFDRTCVRTRGHLSPLWWCGAQLYRALGRIDAVRGVASWAEALAWLESLDRPIRELQYWGHGKWGCALVEREALSARAIARGELDGLRAQLAPGALVWFRTCETFGACLLYTSPSPRDS